MRGKFQFLVFPLGDLLVLATMFFETAYRHLHMVPELAVTAILAVGVMVFQTVRVERRVRDADAPTKARAERDLYVVHAIVFLLLITIYAVVRYPDRMHV